jgi:hypothetical protein
VGCTMGEQDKAQFRSAVKEIKSAIVFEEWEPAMSPLTRLAMFDMLPVISELGVLDRSKLASAANLSHERKRLSDISFRRIQFAFAVVEKRGIEDFQLPQEQVNDGRVFLGCTPLNDSEVEILIQQTLDEANAAIRAREAGTEWATLAGDKYSCCGAANFAWLHILVKKRRAVPRASLNANMAAAAHYMLARFHVCSAQASRWQMDQVIEGYDNQKRTKIANGDRELNSMALTRGNPPFPPDFAIQKWAKRGSAEGDTDRRRCNSNESLPLLIPIVSGSDA